MKILRGSQRRISQLITVNEKGAFCNCILGSFLLIIRLITAVIHAVGDRAAQVRQMDTASVVFIEPVERVVLLLLGNVGAGTCRVATQDLSRSVSRVLWTHC